MQALMQVGPRPDATMVRGRGSWLWDAQGRRYLDFVQGWAVNCLGHCPDVLQAALQQQAQTLINPSPAFHNAQAHGLATALCDNSSLERVFFCNSGAEANEGAIKLARKWGRAQGRYRIITTHGGFHGRTLATMAASGKPGWDAIFPPRVEGFDKVEYGDVAALEAMISDETVAVMLEPIQGEAGVVVPPAGYLAQLRQLTRERDLLLIVDEVQTGIGRTGTLFAHTQEDIEPAIMTLGKGLGGGVPLAALLCTERVACFEPGDQGGTFNGNPLVCAVGQAVLRTVGEAGFLSQVRARGERLEEGLNALSERFGLAGTRGRGLLWAISLPKPCAAEVVQAAFDRGLLINAPKPQVLRLMPALNVSEDEVDQMLDSLADVLSTMFTPTR